MPVKADTSSRWMPTSECQLSVLLVSFSLFTPIVFNLLPCAKVQRLCGTQTHPSAPDPAGSARQLRYFGKERREGRQALFLSLSTAAGNRSLSPHSTGV
jgi:hypothetical protein